MNEDMGPNLAALKESIRKLTRRPLLLVVEDNPDDALLLEAELARFFGHSKIVAVPTGEAALKVIAVEPPDAIFLDLRLPGMSGLEAMRQIREISSAFLIITTGLPEQSEPTLEAIRLGAVKVIAKPITQKDLAETFGTL